MEEHLSEPHNRWELLMQGESSPRSSVAVIAQFANELELVAAKLPKRAPKDSARVYRSLLDVLYVGLQHDILTYKIIEHLRKVGDKYEADRRSGFYFISMSSSSLGEDEDIETDNSNEERRIFATTRSWSNSVPAPHIIGYNRQ